LFNQKNDNEIDFCESYKSQVLGTEEEEEKQSLFSTIIKLLTILLLLAIIIGVTLYGYHYFTNNQNLKNSVLPPVSMQVSDEDTISDEDLVVKLEEPKAEKIMQVESPKIIKEELDIDKMANAIKIEIAKSETKEENETKAKEKLVEINNSAEEINISKNEESLEVPTSAPEAKYLEELADLSREIDRERNK